MSLTRPVIKNPSPLAKTPTSKRESIFDKIDPSKISEGKYLTEGGWGERKFRGLKGQLRMIKAKGYSATKNLSQQNLKNIYTLLSERLKQHRTSYGVHITRRDKKKIMSEGEKLIKTKGSHFSREDKKDLRSIVDTLEQKSRDAIFHRRDFSDKMDDKSALTGKENINYSKPSPTSQDRETPPLIDREEPHSGPPPNIPEVQRKNLNQPLPNIPAQISQAERTKRESSDIKIKDRDIPDPTKARDMAID